ncbi:hypothetical protein VKT23_020591 [Stygiomarasmius scandens]|uniref:Cytochrome P450 n=1 Tax=Marasmiellus scandens TaxID=2682957 RepID=A0ABR1IKI5_9AGAR
MPFSSSTLLAVVLSIIYYRWAVSRTQAPLPPGPKRLPLIGSLLNKVPARLSLKVPNPKPIYQQFLDIGKECNSDIIYIDILGDHALLFFRQAGSANDSKNQTGP